MDAVSLLVASPALRASSHSGSHSTVCMGLCAVMQEHLTAVTLIATCL